MIKYITLDIETGGIGDDKSLLTAYFAILNDSLAIDAELDLRLIPDDGIYHVDPQGLIVNGIDLAKLSREAITYKDAKTKLYNFLNMNYLSGNTRFIPLGLGVAADVRTIKRCIISEGSWNVYVDYTSIDVGIIAKFLQIQGHLPTDLNCGVAALAGHFGVVGQVAGSPHEAKYDALTTALIYRELQKLTE